MTTQSKAGLWVASEADGVDWLRQELLVRRRTLLHWRHELHNWVHADTVCSSEMTRRWRSRTEREVQTAEFQLGQVWQALKLVRRGQRLWQRAQQIRRTEGELALWGVLESDRAQARSALVAVEDLLR